MTDFSKLSKEDLVKLVSEQQIELTDMSLEIDKIKDAAGGRKLQCLKILQTGHVTVESIAKRIGISARNVSSQLSYLRKDGYAIATDSLGRKFLEAETPVTVKTETPTLHEPAGTAKVITRKSA